MEFFKKPKYIYRFDDTLLLIRYTIFDCKFFGIKIHKLVGTDNACQHDHPWAFVTFLMKGGYVEYTPNGSKVYSRFSLLYRPAKYTHKLEIHQPVWTFVITFKRVREWGFHTPKGWIKWFKFTEQDDTCR